MKKDTKIPTLLGLFLLVLGIAAGVVLVGQRQIFRLRGAPETSPQDVRITNITEGGFTVSWSTSSQVQGAVVYGEGESLGQTQTDQTSGLNHHIDIKNLKGNTQYFFKILSGTTTFDKDGASWTQKTGRQLPLRAADIITGTVYSEGTKSQKPVRKALVYITVESGTTLSGITGDEGSFSANLAGIRTTALGSYLSYNNQTILSVFIKPEQGEVASAQVAVGNTRPIPPLILGKTQDLRKITSGQTGELTSPKSNIEIKTPSPTPKGTSGFKSDLEFVSSPSAQTGTASPSPKPLGGTTPTTSPTPTPTPTTKPSGQPTAAPTATPKTSLPGTESGVPVAGNLTMTFILFILGIGSIFMGLVIFKKA